MPWIILSHHEAYLGWKHQMLPLLEKKASQKVLHCCIRCSSKSWAACCKPPGIVSPCSCNLAQSATYVASCKTRISERCYKWLQVSWSRPVSSHDQGIDDTALRIMSPLQQSALTQIGLALHALNTRSETTEMAVPKWRVDACAYPVLSGILLSCANIIPKKIQKACPRWIAKCIKQSKVCHTVWPAHSVAFDGVSV